MVDQVVHGRLGVDHVGHGGEALLVSHGGDHTDARHARHLHDFLILHSDRLESTTEESFEFH